MVIENAIFNLIKEQKLIELGAGSVQDLKKTLKTFDDILESSSQAEIVYHKDMYYEKIIKIKQYIKTNHMGDATFKRLYDRVFIEKLALHGSKIPTLVTRVFEEFVKGITYFKSQIDPSNPVPIYHRFFSCGVGTDIYRQNNLICLSGLTKEEKKRRKPMIERCYIERLIYDKLYTTETLHFPQTGTNANTQDVGHIFRLDLTRKDFESCYPGYKIEVDIEYDGRVPRKLKILRTKNGVMVSEEEYVKELRDMSRWIDVYHNDVACKKKLKNGKVFVKVNTFMADDKWKRIAQP